MKVALSVFTAVMLLLCGCSRKEKVAAEKQFYFGVLQSKKENLKRNREAGANIVVVGIGWNQAEPKRGVYSEKYFGKIRDEIEERRKLGYTVALDLGFQYPPEWIFELPHARYVNQYGQAFSSETIGEEIPNAVFSQAVRDRQKIFLEQVFKRLGKNFAMVRLGWMKYGELAYPIHTFDGRKNCYWAFDDIAQGKADGLVDGLSSCPAAGWIPGTKSQDHKKAEAFLDWYIGALQNYHDWQISTAREFTKAPLAMLYPSWGTRPGSLEKAAAVDLDGSTPSEINGEVQRGLDFNRLVAGIRDSNVYVYCTWIDSSPEFGNDEGTNRAGWSPSRYLAVLAAEHQPPLQIWGENTGGGGMEVLNLCFERIRKYNYSGFLYAFEHHLYDGKKPEIGDFGKYLNAMGLK